MDAALHTPAALRAGAVLFIDLDAVVANWRLLAEMAAAAECAAVMKADAYGLGAGLVGKALWDAGARTFFVAHLEEGASLRAALPQARIIVLHGAAEGTEGPLLEHRLVPMLNSLGEVDRWGRAAQTVGRALPCMVHLDTGMNRLGMPPEELDRLAAEPGRLAGLEVQAWASHLASADAPDNPMTAEQSARFKAALTRLPPAKASLANSAGIFHGPAYHHDLVRPGIALHGGNPTPWRANPMRPTVRLMARILQVRDARPGMTVGYDATHRVQAPGKVASLAMGYADGYPWSLAGKGFVLVGGHRAPVIARVSMDLLTVDASAVPEDALQVGGWAEVIGPARPVDQVAAEAGTISYEVLTRLGSRYHRVYLGAG